jgi:hypothetical protein
LEDDRGGDVGIYTIGNHAEIGNRTARQQIKHLDKAGPRCIRVEQLPKRIAINTDHRDMRGKLIHQDNQPGGKQLVAQVWQTPGIP